MYHSISEQDQNRTHPYFKTNTIPGIFSKHMTYLNRNNYSVINIDEALHMMHSGKPLPDKHAVITFDDGYQDILINALPILKKFNYTATVYLPTRFIGKEGQYFNDRKCLNWQEVIELLSNNITIGSHTETHPKLISLSQQELELELTNSKDVIEDKLGIPCDSFSYPYAFPEENRRFVALLRQLLLKSGYHNTVTTIVGTLEGSTDPFIIKRIPVNSDDDEHFLKAKLEGAYNWIHLPQFLLKSIKKYFKS